MEVLITGAASRLGREIAAAIGQEHRLRLMDTVAVDPPEKSEFFAGSILDPDDAWRAVRGVDAVIHTAALPLPLPAGDLKSEGDRLEWAARGTHVLLSAAADAGVRSCVYAGTLAVFKDYPDDVYISENWKPLPRLEMAEMSNYLGELVCREFVREYRLTCTSLRLGELVPEEETEGRTPDLLWLDPRDAAQAFQCALRLDSSDAEWFRRWNIFHVCADIPNPKYLIDRARSIGYRPVHNFQASWSAAGE
jgi:nucleoside-diphosphate-sugar epimerase